MYELTEQNLTLLLLVFFFSVMVAAALGLIPANIAESKGYDGKRWYFYGWLLFGVALIHAILLPDKNVQMQQNMVGVTDQLKKSREMLDKGIITEDQFAEIKKRLMNLNGE